MRPQAQPELIKTVLALRHQQLPPSLHFQLSNPKIDFEHSPFYVNTALKPWEAERRPRRAGVSSFGIGGTNAHIILEEAPAQAPACGHIPFMAAMLCLSLAYNSGALDSDVQQSWRAISQSTQHLSLAEAYTYTLHHGRKLFPSRRVSDLSKPRRGNHSALNEVGEAIGLHEQRDQKHMPIIFMFPGQGAHNILRWPQPSISMKLFSDKRLIHALNCCGRISNKVSDGSSAHPWRPPVTNMDEITRT